MRVLAIIFAVLAWEGAAWARPVEDGTRVTLFAGARYVPHQHFIDEAQASGDPVSSSLAIGPEALLSFSYAPQPSLEISLEVGYAYDHYTLQSGSLTMQNIPVVASLRWMPFDGRFCPYLGAGGGYMLGMVDGGTADQKDAHSQEFHAMIGFLFPITPTIWLTAEDRFQLASADILPIGQVQTGGNALLVGLSFTLEPAKDIAPH